MKVEISFACLLVGLVVLSAFAEKQPITRYQSIIDRQMFGPLPPGFDPTKSPNEVQKTSSKDERQLTQEQEKLQSSIHFSVINVASDGQTEVGFTDNSDPKAPKHYFMKVGESRDGWTVKEADAEKATMTIAKGDIEVSLSLGGNSAKDGGTSKAGSAPAAAANGMRRPGLLGGGLMGGSMRARRLQRQQAAAADEAKRQEEQAAKDAERQAQAEQEKQQREQERAEQRQQLLAIQEELKRVREQKAAAAKSEDGGDGGENNNAE